MSDQITDTANDVYRDFNIAGSSLSGKRKPPKPEIRALFALISVAMSSLADGVVVGNAVAYSTRAGLFGDLAHAAGKLGVVYNDATAAYNGIYVKSGGSGSGAWTITGLALPSTFAADLASVLAQLDDIPAAVTAALASIASALAAADTAIGTAKAAALAEVAASVNKDRRAAHIQALPGLVGDKLAALWNYEEGVTSYSGGPAITSWATSAGPSLTATLHSTLFSGANPRPKVDPRGMYFNGEAGLTVASAVITNTLQFAIHLAFDTAADQLHTYATEAARDAAGGPVVGDVAKVTADANTTYSPDVALVMDGGYPETDLVNGYSRYDYTSSYTRQLVKRQILHFKGAGTHFVSVYFNHLGQVEAAIYDGATACYVRSSGTDVLGSSGQHLLTVIRDATHWRMILDGEEMMSMATGGLGALSLNTMYMNGETRSGVLQQPVGGMRHYSKALVVISAPTDKEMRDTHDAVARYVGTPLLRRPAEMWGLITSGQSWWEGSLTVDDTWTTPSGWDGQVDLESPSKSGSNNSITREHLKGVYCSRDLNRQLDFGPFYLDLNGLGNIGAGSSHKKGSNEGWVHGLFKQLGAKWPRAAEQDWVISSAGAGGASLGLLAQSTAPRPLAKSLKALDATAYTFKEKLLIQVAGAHDFAQARGQRYVVKAWVFQQGHTIDPDNGSWDTNLLAYYDDVVADIKRITGQADDPIMILPQINYSADGIGNGYVGGSTYYRDQDILDAVTNRGTRPIYCAGPMYQITNFIHAYLLGQRWIGELFGKVLGRILFDGEDGECLRPATFTLGANYVDLTFKGRHGALQFATNSNNIDALLTNRGFEFTDASAGGVTITSVTLTGGNTGVRIGLSGAPAAGDILTYTGPSSRYGNLCDSDSFTALFNDQDWTAAKTGGSPKYAEGNPNDLRNWCVAFRKVL